MRPFLHESSEDEARSLGLLRLLLPADLTTPVRAFLSLRTAGHQVCLLESGEGPEGMASWSFIGVDPQGSFRARGHDCALTWRGDTERYEASPLLGLRTAQEKVRRHGSHTDLPPFAGGWVGYFGYDLVRTLEPVVPPFPTERNPAEAVCLDYFGDVVAFDHRTQRIHVLCDCDAADRTAVAAARARAVGIAEQLYRDPEIPPPVRLLDSEPVSHFNEEAFKAGVRHLQASIARGDIFQGVLSRRMERRMAGDPFTLYRALRLTNPAPHMFYFATPDLTLVGSSPERLVSVRAGRVQTLPIAGTRPRGATPQEDLDLAAELRRDPKELAEHDMLVDLARNDLGRVARIGTVEVVRTKAVERFSRVQHLVSEVAADLRTDRDALDALAACFPAGTVTGAPKIRAMELIAGLEPEGRGAYAGAFGYLDRNGNLDTAITIRTLVVTGGGVTSAGDPAAAVEEWRVSVQAGAGIVFASDPTTEALEVRHKSRALLECIELASSPIFGPPADSPDPDPTP